MIEAVVFDFDGTLTELRLNFQEVRGEILKVLAQYVPAEKLEEKTSPFIIEMIHELSQECEPGNAKALVEDSFRRLVELECEAARGKDVFPFTREILGWLKGRDIRVAITTRNCMEALELVFEDLPDYVDAVVTRNDTRMVKPHPEQIERALAKLGVLPEKTLMVGDHPTDIMAGRACGAKTVGVLTGVTREEDFELAGADYIVPDIRSLPEIVFRKRRTRQGRKTACAACEDNSIFRSSRFQNE
jgi:phosphoglycolate phosphatase